MKAIACLTVAVALCAASAVQAGEVKSGLEEGAKIGAFYVVKCSGAAEDGVAVGNNLCYRCKYGGRPMVMVFTRTADGKVVELAQKLNESVNANTAADLKAFVNILGTDKEAAEAVATEFGTKNKLDNVPVVVPNEFENGPENYGINPEADVTVIVAANSTVVASRGYKGGLSDDAVAAILADIEKALK